MCQALSYCVDNMYVSFILIIFTNILILFSFSQLFTVAAQHVPHVSHNMCHTSPTTCAARLPQHVPHVSHNMCGVSNTTCAARLPQHVLRVFHNMCRESPTCAGSLPHVPRVPHMCRESPTRSACFPQHMP